MDSRSPPSRTALVVDGYQPTLTLLQYVLEDAGFETTTVDHGSAAMTLLAERRFDLLLVSISLPDMNGLVICNAARERYQGRIVILVMNGLEIEPWGVTALQLCADDYLGKPFDVDELIARIERKLRRAPKG
jgi:two-component system alkaline phosphatase synthesis response regulator PhoP